MEPSTQSDDRADLSQAIDRLWLRFLPEIRERVAVLEAAAAAVAAQKLSRAQCEEAQAAAHKLAGVLGTFNLTRGTVLAREMEMTYSREDAPGGGEGERLTAAAAELSAMVEARKPSA